MSLPPPAAGTGAVNYAASGLKVAGAVAFHPGSAMAAPKANVTVVTPLLVLTGGADIAVATVLQTEQALTNASSSVELQRYGQIRHAFTSWTAGDYDAYVDAKSWASAGEFLALQFGVKSLKGEQAAQRCGAELLGRDENQCCDVCVPAPNCAAVLCAAPLGCESGDVITKQGECCPVCKPVCAGVKCPVVACAGTRRLVVPEGECCGTCKPACGAGHGSCPVAVPQSSGVLFKKIHYQQANVNLTGVLYFNVAWSSKDAPRPLVVIVHDYNGIDWVSWMLGGCWGMLDVGLVCTSVRALFLRTHQPPPFSTK